MMNDEVTAWTYVRHEETARDHSAASPPAWWKICDGQLEQVTEADVLGDGNIVHFLVYTRHEDDSSNAGKETTKEEAAEEVDGGKPSKTIRLDSVLDWWAKTPLVVSTSILPLDWPSH